MPARFVSGHFLRSDGTVHQQAGHAWAEAYVPDLGWVGFDAANGLCTTDAHARVAIGLDYLGAAPVRGTRYGGGTETLTVAVKVEQAGRPGQWQSQSQSRRPAHTRILPSLQLRQTLPAIWISWPQSTGELRDPLIPSRNDRARHYCRIPRDWKLTARVLHA